MIFIERMQNAMTEDDKAKLYAAIGYTEEIPDTVFPKEVSISQWHIQKFDGLQFI